MTNQVQPGQVSVVAATLEDHSRYIDGLLTKIQLCPEDFGNQTGCPAICYLLNESLQNVYAQLLSSIRPENIAEDKSITSNALVQLCYFEDLLRKVSKKGVISAELDIVDILFQKVPKQTYHQFRTYFLGLTNLRELISDKNISPDMCPKYNSIISDPTDM
jgi:hypothetical protein